MLSITVNDIKEKSMSYPDKESAQAPAPLESAPSAPGAPGSAVRLELDATLGKFIGRGEILGKSSLQVIKESARRKKEKLDQID